jgi:hypothetical protein
VQFRHSSASGRIAIGMMEQKRDHPGLAALDKSRRGGCQLCSMRGLWQRLGRNGRPIDKTAN